MTETQIPTLTGSAIIPPAIKTVGRCCRDPFGIISSGVLVLSGLLLASLDFTAGIFVLPIILLDLLSVLCSFGKAKVENSKFCLPFVKFTGIFCIIISVLLFTMELLEVKGYIVSGNPWQGVADGLPFPLNILINKGFLGTEMYMLSLTAFYLGKLISAYSLSNCVKKNLPKRGAQILAAILMMLSFLSLIQDGLDRIGLLPSHYKYCGPELQKNIIMYTTALVPLLTAIAVLLQIIKTFKIHTKMRKLKNAF